MKLAFTYALFMTLSGAALMLLLYFLGFQSSVEKFQAGQWIGGIGGVALSAVFLALAMREKRADFPAVEEWGYGNALGAGVLTGLFASLFGIVTAYFYFFVLNPEFSEINHQVQIRAMEAKGMSPADIAKIEPAMRMFSKPALLLVFQVIGGFFFSTIISLIVAIFFRKREQPPVVATPAT
ncbi:MAG TPA: DUF4199 domain-containing protein [Opitutaceae bacterium]